ncbi:MAG: hypothetical protein EBS38_02880 [Actinobacteria bacterium]|nr:hypothetical protein [Actinomycetota bacterium]
MARTKMILDNDFGGDPDGLFGLAHHLLSPSADIRMVVVSHVMPNDPNWPTEGDSVQKGLRDVEPIYQYTGVWPKTYPGLNEHQIQHQSLDIDETLKALIAEVESTEGLLWYICGGPMTQLARLVRAKPKNLDKLRVLWIGGSEYDGIYPPGGTSFEYNLAADPESVSIVFANPDIELWHIPRDSYRRCVVSFAELNAKLRNGNDLSRHLLQTISKVRVKTLENGIDIGETYCMGDQALVLLSVLENSFEPTPAGSNFYASARYAVNLDGSYGEDLGFAKDKTRVFKELDTRILFEDMFAKFGGASGEI